MSNQVASQQTTNIVPVQGLFQPEPTFDLITFIGPAGTPFLPPINPIQSGLTITNSTIDSSVIGGSSPAAATFTNIAATTGTISTLPSGNTDIANKQYVDSVAQGLNIKAACAYSTTANITLSGLGTQAGGDWPSSLTAGDRILVKNQGSSQFNGIYVAAAGPWTRATDMNAWAEVPSAFTFVQQGTTLADTGWVCTSDAGGTIDVTPITWTQFSGAGSYLAGNGLQLIGNTFSVLANGTTINVSASGIKLSDNYAGQATITTVGTLTAGTWNANTIGVAYGGTGATTFTAGYVKANGTLAFSTVATIPNTDISGLGTMSTQDANNVAITGGSVAVTTLKTLGLTGYLYGNNTSAVTASTTIPNTAITGLGTMSTQNANNVAITGGTITGLTNLGADYLQFNTAATVTPAVGRIWFDGGTTLEVGMTANVVGRVNESEFVYVKASSAITKGQLCYHTGAVGGSGVVTAAPTPLNLADPNQIIGVAAEDIANNAFGLIQISGTLRGFNTTGSSVGETWADGDPLYYNPAYVGGLTKTKPSAPNQKTYIGEVINAGSGGSGSMNIRIVYGSVLGGTDSNVQFGTLNNNDLIQYDSTATYWKNVAPSTVSVGTATNLAGGAAGSIPYQSGAGTTAFLASAAGDAGKVLQSNGSSAPSWVTPTAYATVTDDTTTNATRYPLFANQTTGNLSTEFTSSTKLQYNPSTGTFTATVFSGSGASLTNLPAGQLSGTIPSAVLGNSSLYIGTTQIALNRASASQSLTGVNIDGSAGSASTATTATNATNIAITDNTSSSATWYPVISANSTGNNPATVSSTKLSFVPNTGVLTATSFSGAGTGLTGTASGLSIGGNAATATTATTASAVANAVTFTNTGGAAAGTTFNGSAARTIDYSTVGAPSATGTGASGTWGISISGNAATATSATSATNATNIGITDDTSTNADMYLTWVTANTGNLPAKVTSTKLKFNPSSGAMTVTGGIGGGAF